VGLLISIFLTKDSKKIIKRIMGVIIPCQFFLAYLIKNNALLDCINYAFLGMFDFGGDNGNITIWTLIAIYIFGFFIYNYIKTKDLNCIYGISFLAIAAPLFDMYHTTYAVIPFIIYTCATRGKLEKYIKVIFSILLFFFIIENGYSHIKDEMNYYITDKDSNYHLILTKKTLISYYKDIYKYYQNHIEDYQIYFLDNNIYYMKLEHNIPINKFDLFLKGNNGYDGTNRLKKEIRSMTGKVLFLVDEMCLAQKGMDIFDQTNHELIEFVVNNYTKIDTIREGYNIYEIVNDFNHLLFFLIFIS